MACDMKTRMDMTKTMGNTKIKTQIQLQTHLGHEKRRGDTNNGKIKTKILTKVKTMDRLGRVSQSESE